MASIGAFRAYRPPAEHAGEVTTRTADTYSPLERERILSENPVSFLHVIFPEAGQKKKLTQPNTRARFEKVKQRFETFRDQEIFIREESPALYLYELRSETSSFLGFVGTASVRDQEKGMIRKHEQTLEKREELLKEYLKVCDINADPVLLCHQKDHELEKLAEDIRTSPPAYDLSTDDDDRHHRLWPVYDKKRIEHIKKVFHRMPALYIADGHHRSASSVRLAEEMRGNRQAEQCEGAGQEHFMAYFIPEDQLEVHGYHRCIKDLNGFDVQSFLLQLEKDFVLTPEEAPIEPKTLHEFGLYLDGSWYRLHPRSNSFDHEDPVGALDASILYDRVLWPLLNVKDARNSERVYFHGSPKGLNPMIENVDQGSFRMAFTLAPVPVEQLKEVADQGLVMPPKTTWSEPKLRSGFLIYRMGLHGS